jgi:hypothetical protein
VKPYADGATRRWKFTRGGSRLPRRVPGNPASHVALEQVIGDDGLDGAVDIAESEYAQ